MQKHVLNGRYIIQLFNEKYYANKGYENLTYDVNIKNNYTLDASTFNEFSLGVVKRTNKELLIASCDAIISIAHEYLQDKRSDDSIFKETYNLLHHVMSDEDIEELYLIMLTTEKHSY